METSCVTDDPVQSEEAQDGRVNNRVDPEAAARGAAKSVETRRLLRLAGKLGSGAQTGTSRRRKILENAAWWAAQAKEGARPKTKLQQMLLKLRNDNPDMFLKSVLMQVLPQAPKLPAIIPGKEETASEVLGDSLELLNRWWEERQAK